MSNSSERLKLSKTECDRAAHGTDPSGRPAPKVYWDTKTVGFGLRVGMKHRTFIVQRDVHGRTIRRKIGEYGPMTLEEARTKALEMFAQMASGKAPPTARNRTAAASTVAEALREYTDKKRRTKDKLPLKPRTKADYLEMVAEGREKADGSRFPNGELFPLASKPIEKITAEDIRVVHRKALLRGERRAAYAMQVLRAVLNWHGIRIPDNPLSAEVAGKDRISIPPPNAASRPIPPEQIGGWWRAVQEAGSEVARDYIAFMALTGCRPAEPLGILVQDCDLKGGRVLLKDTKNRKDHTLILSRQAQAIVIRQAEGKHHLDRLFSIVDAKWTVAGITERSGVPFRLKDLRSTFASIAAARVPYYTLKRMMNHANTGDVTGTHYVNVSESDLRQGWQAVADWIQGQAEEAAKGEE